VTQDSFWSRFRRWRRKRPFWGGFFLVLSALELLYTANMNLGSLEVHLGPQGFLSYLLPLLLLLCGVLSWFTPAQRVFYGIIGLLTALYTFLGLNLGGFFLGMLLGIVGGALVIAWGPPRPKQRPPTDADGPAPDPEASATPATVEIAGHDDRSHEPPVRRPVQDSDTAFIPGLGGPGGPTPEPPRGGPHKNPRALTVALLLITMTAGLLVAGSSLPASAVECPEGLPSRSSVTSSVRASAVTTPPESPAGGSSRPTTEPPAGSKPATSAPTSSASAGADAEEVGADDGAEEGDDGSVLGGIGDFFDGVGNLLGVGAESPAPSTSPAPSEPAPGTSAPATPESTRTATPTTTGGPTPTVSAPASGSAATSASASAPGSPSASADEIPCLGPRVMGKKANPDGIPRVVLKPGKMEVDSLTMYDSTYDGVVDMPTDNGSVKALKFSMDKAVNKPFTLTMDEAGNAVTVIKSNELVTDGNVRFYTPEFQANLFGVIPVTFTPEQPPPLTLPILWFTDVTIKLAYVRCDTLTADPLDIREKLTAAS